MTHPLLNEVDSILKIEAQSQPAPAAMLTPAAQGAPAANLAAAQVFSKTFGDNLTDAFVQGFGMKAWVPNKALMQQNLGPGAPMDFEAELAFVNPGNPAQVAFHLKASNTQRLIIAFSHIGGVSARIQVMLLETGWEPIVSAPLPAHGGLEPSHPEEASGPRTFAHFTNLQQQLQDVLERAATHQATYTAVIAELQGGAPQLKGSDLVPKVFDGLPDARFSELIGAARNYLSPEIVGGAFKDPALDAFLRHLIRTPHTLSALALNTPAAPWVLVRHRDPLDLGHSPLAATTLPLPGTRPATRPATRLQLPIFNMSFELDPTDPRAVIHELGAALLGLLVEA